MEHQLSFGVEREVLADELQYYFEQANAADIVDEEFSASDSRGKANGILRRLENYGWIEIETDKSYVQRVNFKDYAVKLIKTLLEIRDGKKVEYQGYIYTIYSLVRTQTDNPGVVLLQILDNTDMLITGLKNLNSSIKHYIDELTRHSTVSEIMDALFNDYITNIVDKAYHRLITSDNVSKFRPEIIERLEQKSRSAKYMDQTAAEIAAMQEISAEDAKDVVYRYLHEVIEAFRNMDDILSEIDRKNTQYQRSAVNRAKFLLSGNEDVRGQIKELLMGINEVMNRENPDPAAIYEIEFLDGLVRLYGSSFLDEASFYSPIEGKKEFIPAELDYDEVSEELKREKLRRMTEKMARILSKEKIGRYVSEQLAGRNEKKASEFPLDTTEDFIKLIYVRLYGQRKDMDYKVEVLGNVEVGGFSFPDFCISRK
ncbi:MAG: DUF5716 family protein [Eubacteriales bacterium]|nr:DUF5716 family protein [Eubacteriales bacterium]